MSLFIALFVLTVLVGVLGIGTLIRLGRTEESEELSPLFWLFMILASALLAWFSSFLPFLAIVPTVLFLLAGLRLLARGGPLRIDSGIVLLLAGVTWGVFLALQTEMMEWEKSVGGASIRVDVLFTVPAMTLITVVGWMIERALAGQLARASIRP